MEYVLYIGGGLLVLALIFAAFIATRAPAFRVERSRVIAASPDSIFHIVNDLSQWRRWSPYDKRDPNMKTALEGSPQGPGCSYSWDGNNKVGSGKMAITESKPGELVAMNLQFNRPFRADNLVRFTMTPADGGTGVAWIMDGKKNFIFKGMSLLMNMDATVGKDFEEGLANLERIAMETQQPTL